MLKKEGLKFSVRVKFLYANNIFLLSIMFVLKAFTHKLDAKVFRIYQKFLEGPRQHLEESEDYLGEVEY